MVSSVYTVYTVPLAAAQTVLNNSEATQDEVDAAEKDLRRILRPLQLPEVNFDEDNIVLSFGAISDIHITGSTTSLLITMGAVLAVILGSMAYTKEKKRRRKARRGMYAAQRTK